MLNLKLELPLWGIRSKKQILEVFNQAYLAGPDSEIFEQGLDTLKRWGAAPLIASFTKEHVRLCIKALEGMLKTKEVSMTA